jgi:hypothetical protein
MPCARLIRGAALRACLSILSASLWDCGGGCVGLPDGRNGLGLSAMPRPSTATSEGSMIRGGSRLVRDLLFFVPWWRLPSWCGFCSGRLLARSGPLAVWRSPCPGCLDAPTVGEVDLARDIARHSPWTANGTRLIRCSHSRRIPLLLSETSLRLGQF